MGYTHYWRGTGIPEHENYARAIGEMATVAAGAGVPLKIDFAPGSVCFNGVDPDDCEPFVFPGESRHDDGFTFCKTRQLPYDVAVTACLAVAAELLPVKVSSDGDPRDWAAGVALASRVLGRAVPNPIHADAEDE